MSQMKKAPKIKRPIAVLISDVHYNLNTLQIADDCMRLAIDEASSARLPLVVMGDLNDTKAIIRGEVANALIKTLEYAESQIGRKKVLILVGNHDKLSEKGVAHSLEFLKPYAQVIEEPEHVNLSECYVKVIPYQSTRGAFKAALEELDAVEGDIILCHQGILGADMGGYVQDHSAIAPEDIQYAIVVSGHYHKHHSVGNLTYVGNPYTLTFGEANDGPKGFCILFDDGTLEQLPIAARKHVVIDITAKELDEAAEVGADPFPRPNPGDLVWLKLRGLAGELEGLDKKHLAQFIGHESFKLDKIVDKVETAEPEADKSTDEEIMDFLIDQSNEAEPLRKDLKALWRELMS